MATEILQLSGPGRSRSAGSGVRLRGTAPPVPPGLQPRHPSPAECRSAPLELTAIESGPREVRSPRRCESTCGRSGEPLGTSCGACLEHDVELGYLRCPGCERFYFIEHGIPTVLGDGFASMIDGSFARRHAEAFGQHRDALERYLQRLERASTTATHEWNMDDVRFWEDKVYGDDAEREAIFERIARSRPDAGNRTYPRERTIFRHVRPELRGGILLDLGCGISQTVRTICDPAREGYVYVGVELSRSAMLVNRETLDGDFVICSVDALPFRDGSVDAAVMLGTLHHLAEHGPTLDRIVQTVRPGGLVALDEVIARHGLTERISRRFSRRPPQVADESAHNEYVDPDVILGRLRAAGDVISCSLEFSPVRGAVSARIGEAMRTRPWLTKLVLGLDRVILSTVGRVVPVLGPHQILVVARRRAAARAKDPQPAVAAR